MFGPIDHINEHRRRIRPAPTGLVVFREGPQHNRLRSDPERVRAEGGDRLERLNVAASGLEEPLSAGPGRRIGPSRRPVFGSLPLEPHSANPEVVANRHPEPQRVGVQEHITARRHIDRNHDGGLVGPRLDHKRQRPCPGESVEIPPLEFNGRFLRDLPRHEPRDRSVRLDGHAVCRRRGELPVGRRHEHNPTAGDGDERASADLLPHDPGASEVVRERDLRGEAHDLRPGHGLDPGSVAGISSREGERAGDELRRQREGVALALERRGQRLLTADPGSRPLRPPTGLVGQPHWQAGRFATRHHDRLLKPLNPREREAVGLTPRSQESGPRIGGRLGDKPGCRGREHKRNGRRQKPDPVPRTRHRPREVDRP